MRRLSSAFLLCASLTFAADPEFAKDGQLARPKDYREWIYLSSGLAMTYGPAASENKDRPRFDNVFVEPSAYRKFMQTGTWPDKTMFALEVRESQTKGSINNAGRYQGAVAAVEVAVKDLARFKGPEENGWAYFGFNPTASTAKRFGAEAGCNACHSKNAAVDNTFVQFYPTLLEVARTKGTLKPSYTQAEAAAH